MLVDSAYYGEQFNHGLNYDSGHMSFEPTFAPREMYG